MDKAMMRALEADGDKLRQLTGEDHGPFCPTCLGDGGRRCIAMDYYGPVEEFDECPDCLGTGKPPKKEYAAVADDLVKRLLKASEDYSLWCKDDCAKAADEIARLRDLLGKTTALAHSLADDESGIDDNEIYKAAIAALR